MKKLNHFIPSVDSYFILFLIFCALYYLIRATGGGSDFPGDLGDTRFNQIILEHLFKWSSGQESSLWSPGYFYPFSGVLAFSDNHFGSMIFYAIWRFLGVPRETSFNLWFCIGVILTSIAFFWVMLRIGLGYAASAAGAFVFTFALPVLVHEEHSQLIYRFPIPLALFALMKYFDGRRSQWLAVVAIWTAWQFLCSIYLGVFLVYLLGATTFALWMTRSDIRPVHLVVAYELDLYRSISNWRWVLAGLLWIATGMMLYKYSSISLDYGLKRPIDYNWLPRIGSYFIADNSRYFSWIGNWVKDITYRSDQQLFVGLGAVSIALYGYIGTNNNNKKWHLHTRIFGLALFALFILTLYVDGGSLYWLLLQIPGIHSIRIVSRIVIVMLFPVSMLVAIGTFNLCEKYKSHKKLVLLIVAILLSADIVTHVPSKTSIIDARHRVEEIAKNIDLHSAENKNKVILSLDLEEGGNYAKTAFNDIDAVILAQDFGVKTFNGYSGFDPRVGIFPKKCDDIIPWLTSISKRSGEIKRSLVYPDLTQNVLILPVGKCDNPPNLK